MTQSSYVATPPAMVLFGGDWSLDFANSHEDWEDGYAQLLAWSEQVGLVSAERARAMERRAASAPAEAQAALARALALQATLHSVFWALAHGRAVASGDLASLNQRLAPVMAKLRLLPVEPVGQSQGGEATYQWTWAEDDALDRMLWPVTRAAAELLQSPNLRWLKACAGEGCDRLFLDLSRNHSRRWCEMRHCGMLAKTRRHYAKKRQARARG